MTDTAVTVAPGVAARLGRGWLAGALGALVGLAALAAVAWGPGGLTLDVGQPGDRLFLDGFHGDERAGGRDYRWTRASSQVIVPGLGGAAWVRVTLLAEGGRTPPQPAPLTVLVDGAPAGVVAVGPAAEATIEAERQHPDEDSVTITLQAPTFRPAGDARDLGVIVDRVAVAPVAGGWSARAWAERWLRLAALAALAALILWPLRRRAPAGVWFGLAGLAVGAAGAVARPWLLAGWPWLLAALAGAALVVHRERAAEAAVRGLAALARPRVAAVALAALVAADAVVMTALAARIAWIGHADYADNAVVARNLVLGRGYTVDYVAQFYHDYPPAISHPSDVWPLLQPTLIAGSFLLFGISTFAAKLPNVAALAGLLLATAWVGRRLFGWPAGLAAAGLVALDGWFFENTLFPVNDVPFSLLALLLIGLAAGAGERGRGGAAGREPGGLEPVAPPPRPMGGAAATAGSPAPPLRRALALGVCAGLVVVAKPSGLLLVAGVAGWWLWQRRLGGAPARAGWRWAALAAGVALLVVAPVVARNLLTFGAPFYSLQSFDAWVTKWEPPDENIYRLMQAEPPHPRRLVAFGLDRAAEAVALQFRKLGNDVAAGALIELPLLALAAVGLLLGGAVVRRQTAVLAWATVPYLLFVLVYWHYEKRYVVFLIPWLCLLAAGGAAALLTRALASGERGQRWLALGLLAVGLALLAPARLDYIGGQTAKLLPAAGDVVVGEWLAANTPADAVVMTRVPWQITWHSGRRTVMIPLAPLEGIEATIRRYGVDYLLVDRFGQAAIRRAALQPLYEGREAFGFVAVQEFRNQQGVRYATLYRVPERLREAP
jgi:4-amino-4-deoxy-L-arabinose transferase-like glycosyltransferase